MVTNAKLESQFKAFFSDCECTKKTLHPLCEKFNSIDAKLDKLCSMREDMKKLEVAILAKYPDRKTIYQQLRDPKLEPSLSPPLLKNVAPVTPSKFDGHSTENLLLQQPQLHIGLVPQGVAF